MDLLAGGTLSLPSGVSRDKAVATVRQAQDVGAAAALLHDPDALAAFANPSPAAVTLAKALFGSWGGAQDVIGDTDAAADLLRGLISPLRSHPHGIGGSLNSRARCG